MSPNPLLAMAPINVQTTSAVQGSPNNANSISNQQHRQTRHNMQVNGSPHRKNNKRQRERNTPSPKHHRGSPKPKQSTSTPSSRRNYTPPPRFQKLGQTEGVNKNFTSSSTSPSSNSSSEDSSMSMSSDENSNDSTKELFAGSKFHSEAPRPENLPMPPSNWLIGCLNRATTMTKSEPAEAPDYQEQLANELKCMLKVAL